MSSGSDGYRDKDAGQQPRKGTNRRQAQRAVAQSDPLPRLGWRKWRSLSPPECAVLTAALVRACV